MHLILVSTELAPSPKEHISVPATVELRGGIVIPVSIEYRTYVNNEILDLFSVYFYKHVPYK